MLYTAASKHLQKIMKMTLCTERRQIITAPLDILSSEFDGCQYSWAVPTPAKYECDIELVTRVLTKVKILWKWRNSGGGFSDPHPCLW